MLMHEQLLTLREKAINTCYINSMLTKENREAVIANLSRPDSEYKVLMSPTMQKLLQKLKSKGRLNFFAIDKAHCIYTSELIFVHSIGSRVTFRNMGFQL